MPFPRRLRVSQPNLKYPKFYRQRLSFSSVSHVHITRALTTTTQTHRSPLHETSTSSFAIDTGKGLIDPISRLNAVNDIIIDQSTSLSKKCSHIVDLYTVHNADFIDDLKEVEEMGKRQSNKEDTYESSLSYNDEAISNRLACEIKDWLLSASSLSTSALAMILALILDRIVKGELLVSCEMLQLLSESRQNTKSQHTGIEELYEFLSTEPQLTPDQRRKIETRLGETCILLAVASGRPILATLLLFSSRSQLSISQTTVEKILLALSASHPLKSNYNNYAILKVLNTMCDMNLEPGFYLRLITNVSQGANDPFFPNILFLHALKLFNFLSNTFTENIDSLRHLIHINLEHGNTSRALMIWKLCYKHDSEFALRNISIFKRLFAAADKSTQSNLLKEYFPSELQNHPSIFDSILSFYGQNPETTSKFSNLAKSITPPISRSLLSSLLASFLVQRRTKEVKQLTKAINNSQGGLLPAELNAMIEELLKNSDLSEAIRIVVYYNVLVSKQGLVRIADYLLSKDLDGVVVDLEPEDPLNEVLKDYVPQEDSMNDSELSNDAQLPNLKNHAILNFVGTELSRLENDRALCDFTVVLTKYLSQKYGSGVGRRLFMNRDRERAQGFTFDFVRFGLPKIFASNLRIDRRNRLACIGAILSQAKQEKDRISIEWCIAEFRKSGLLVEDIIDTYLNEIS